MIKIVLGSIALLSASIPSLAQSKFYFTPSVSAGIGNSRLNKQSPSGDISYSANSIFTYGTGLGIGYRVGGLNIESGLRYDLSGFRHDYTFSDLSGPFNAEIAYKFHHISIPLRVGYEIKMGKRFSITPLAGIVLSYNAGRSHAVSGGDLELHSRMDSEHFSDMYNRVSLWGTGAIRFNYKISDKVSIFVAPTVQYMISNSQKSTNYMFNTSQRNYNIGIEIGVKIDL